MGRQAVLGRVPKGRFVLPAHEDPEHPRSLESARRWNAKWGRVVEEFGFEAPRVRKILGCATRSDVWEHAPRAAGSYGGGLCPVTFELGEGVRTSLVRPYVCNDTRTCIVCSTQYARERAASVRDVFHAIAVQQRRTQPSSFRAGKPRDVRGLDVEFTTPPSEWDFLAQWSNHFAFVKVCGRALLRVVRVMHPEVLEIATATKVHEASSSHPWRAQPHVHLLSMNLGRLADGSYRETKFHLDEEHLALLKRFYREEYAKEFARSLPEDVVVHYAFFNIDRRGSRGLGLLSRQAEHKFLYNFRSPLDDVAKGLRLVDFDDGFVLWQWRDKERELHNEAVPVPEFFGGVISNLERPQNYRAVRFGGFLADHVKDASLRELGINGVDGIEQVLRDLREPEKEPVPDAFFRAGECPLCGGMTYLHARGVLIDAIVGPRLIVGITSRDELHDIISRSLAARETISGQRQQGPQNAEGPA